MELTKVRVSNRSDSGKEAAQRLRRTGLIPAVAYGRKEHPLPLSVSPGTLRAVLEGELGRNTVLELDLEGGSPFVALLCDYQVHPISRSLLHADFFRIALDEPVDVDVPFRTTGKSPGVVLGGTLHVVFHKLPIRCLPKDIPVSLSADISGLELDGHISVANLPVPEGVSIRLPENQTLVAVVNEAKATDDTATADGAAAAPAAGAAAPAAAPGDKAAAAKPAAGAAAKPAAGAGKPAKGK